LIVGFLGEIRKKSEEKGTKNEQCNFANKFGQSKAWSLPTVQPRNSQIGNLTFVRDTGQSGTVAFS
jgi:hypothetical protein